MSINSVPTRKNISNLMTFLAITLFFFYESAQMGYFNVLAPSFLSHAIYNPEQIASLSAAYVYGCMFGLIPVGYALDHHPLRKMLLWAILGSVVGAFLLLLSQHFSMQWFARFVCGFFGGAFSFAGGIRVIFAVYHNRFTFFMGLFISAGMFGGFVSQYPLLFAVDRFGITGTIAIVAIFGLIVMLFNLLYLHPAETKSPKNDRLPISNFWDTAIVIIKNYRNWTDCLMVILLDTPVSIIGTLWGIVILMNCYHITDVASSWIVMALFIGLIIGSPVWGALADRYQYPTWIITIGSFCSFLIVAVLLIFPQIDHSVLAVLFLGLGFFSSCQTLGFTWLTKNMRPDLIGRNSAFNSMLFMVTNGGFKQLGAFLLATTPMIGLSSATNLLLLIAGCMLASTVYGLFRKSIGFGSATKEAVLDGGAVQ